HCGGGCRVRVRRRRERCSQARAALGVVLNDQCCCASVNGPLARGGRAHRDFNIRCYVASALAARCDMGPDTFVEDTRIARQFGFFEFLRRAHRDQLSLFVPEMFGRNMIYSRFLFLHSFLIDKPEYIEQVLLDNQANYRKSHFLRHILGPLLGDGLLISEGEFWRRQRRIAAPAFHSRRIADFVATMVSCTEATLARWRATTEPFDIAAEMMALTLNIVSRTMFSTDVSGDVEAVRRLTDIVVALKPSTTDLLGLPEWFRRRRPKGYQRAITEFEALVSRFLAERRTTGI